MSDRSILLIDDDEDDREFFLEAIEEYNPEIRCIEARNGQEGLDFLNAEKIRPDIIFLDLNMPLMNGRQFLLEIKKIDHLKHIPIVILTTSSDNKTIQDCLAIGASYFITKPDKFSLWVTTISDYLNNHSFGKSPELK